jgi:HSP20 family protein
MAVIRWEPARELHTVQGEINRLFNSLFDTPTHATALRTRGWVPATDLVEGDSEYVLRADLPGLGEDDVTIEVENDVLTVSGERKGEHEEKRQGYYRLERSFGSFRRSLRLPEGVDAGAIVAGFDKGVLEIRVPKPAARKPHRVAITVGGERPAIES